MRRDYSNYAATAIIFIFALFRVIKAVVVPISYDEAFTFLVYSKMAVSGILSDYTYPNNHILNSLLIKLFTYIFGDSEFIIRLPAVIFGVIFCIFVYKVSEICIKNRLFRIVYLLLVLSNPFLIDFNSIARGYSIGMAFAFASLYYILKYFGDEYYNLGIYKKIGVCLSIAVLSALSIAAVPTFLNFFLALWPVLFVVYLADYSRGRIRLKLKETVVFIFFIIGPTILFAGIVYMNIDVSPSKIPFGFSLQDSINGYINNVLFYETKAEISKSIITKSMLMVMFFVSLAANIIRKNKRIYILQIVFAAIVFITLSEYFILKIKCPYPRILSYTVPLFCLMFIPSSGKRTEVLAYCIPVFLLFSQNVSNINLSYYQAWKNNSIVKDVMLIMKEQKTEDVKLIYPWYLDFPIHYYEKRFSINIVPGGINEPGSFLIAEPNQEVDNKTIIYEKYGYRLAAVR